MVLFEEFAVEGREGGEMEGWRRGDGIEGREDGGDRGEERWRGWKMEGMEDGGDRGDGLIRCMSKNNYTCGGVA